MIGFTALKAGFAYLGAPLSPQAIASLIFGLYSSFAYFLPVFRGLVGDSWLGQHRMVAIGAVLMAIGHFLMAFEAPFLIALLLPIVGSGCMKGNISTQVGSLYAADDRRRTDAFQIFLIGITSGVVLAPLGCRTLGELFGWHYGFAAAGIGMLIGLLICLAGRRHLPPDRRPVRMCGKPVPLARTVCDDCGSARDGKGTAPVRRFPPNPFGLYDMLGQVFEWNADCWNDSYRGAPADGSAWMTGDCTQHPTRGGSWNLDSRMSRAAQRGRDGADYAGNMVGFRVVRDLP